ncbi:hypothetical protein [Planococcus versutus]|uniref:Uncharacterized protein n=1 Tax=Planococcus versutus TaxID=1302659 RepID=A0A1B1RZC9_9BACL|nr:hypothetical protein [Planococcus versutus]ANU26277.1 hypothetical protein I858_004425 [Planococcus versutus]
MEFLKSILNLLTISEWIMLLTGLATIITAIATLSNVKELRNQRIESQQPSLVFEHKEVRIDIKSDDSIYHDNQLIKSPLEYFYHLELNVENIGRGPAKEVIFEWEFAEEVLNKVKEANSSKINIEVSQKDEKERLYFFQVYSDVLMGENEYNMNFMNYHPHPENQFDPMYSYKKSKVHYRTDTLYKVKVEREFAILSFLYGFSKKDARQDMDYKYLPSVNFSVKYKDSHGFPHKQKFQLECQSYLDAEENEGTLFLLYEVHEIPID